MSDARGDDALEALAARDVSEVEGFIDGLDSTERFYLADTLRRLPSGVGEGLRVFGGAHARTEVVTVRLSPSVRSAACEALVRHGEQVAPVSSGVPFRARIVGLEPLRARAGREPNAWRVTLARIEGEPDVHERVRALDGRAFIVGHPFFVPLAERERTSACSLYAVGDAQPRIGDELLRDLAWERG